jgi:hypothetical protein
MKTSSKAILLITNIRNRQQIKPYAEHTDGVYNLPRTIYTVIYDVKTNSQAHRRFQTSTEVAQRHHTSRYWNGSNAMLSNTDLAGFSADS